MHQERILAIHDISCVGRCSLTVALPIISSVGIECSGLPTAVLSTHTGGFTGFTYRDLTEDMVPIDQHWQSLGIKFDAFYTGFLGSFEQIDIVKRLFTDLSHEGTRIYVDPVMADKGKLYSVFGPDFPAGMRQLCEMADVIMPNITELSFMLGIEYRDGPYTREYIASVLEQARVFGVKQIVLTGISYEPGKIGAVYMDYTTGDTGEVMRNEIPGYYHGTGDVFSSAFVGAFESGLTLRDAVTAAVNFTVGSIVRTYDAKVDIRYGVNFEAGLKDYIAEVDAGRRGPSIVPATTDSDIRTLAQVASEVWREAFKGIVPDDQIEYMLDRFQSYEAMRRQIDEEGYTYLMIKEGSKVVGYAGYAPRGDRLFLSKIYIGQGLRARGLRDHRLPGQPHRGRLHHERLHHGDEGLTTRRHVHTHHPRGGPRSRMGFPGHRARFGRHLHGQRLQRHSGHRALARGPRVQGGHHRPARHLLRGRHLEARPA